MTLRSFTDRLIIKYRTGGLNTSCVMIITFLKTTDQKCNAINCNIFDKYYSLHITSYVYFTHLEYVIFVADMYTCEIFCVFKKSFLDLYFNNTHVDNFEITNVNLYF